MKTRHIHALIAVGAVGGLLGFHHWLTPSSVGKTQSRRRHAAPASSSAPWTTAPPTPPDRTGGRWTAYGPAVPHLAKIDRSRGFQDSRAPPAGYYLIWLCF